MTLRRRLRSHVLTRKSAIASTWTKFAATTTLGGLFQAYESKHVAARVFWVSIFLTLTVATVWNTWKVVSDYLSYPVVTSITATYGTSLPFPMVTVCNRNPIQCPKLAAAYIRHPDELRSLMEYSLCWKTVLHAPLNKVVSAHALVSHVHMDFGNFPYIKCQLSITVLYWCSFLSVISAGTFYIHIAYCSKYISS
jgi:hypothetical protein